MRMSTAPVVFWTLFFLRPVRPIFDLRPLWGLVLILGSDFAFSRFRSSFMLFFFENADCEGERLYFDEKDRSFTFAALLNHGRHLCASMPSLIPNAVFYHQSLLSPRGVIWRFTTRPSLPLLDRSPELYQGVSYSVSSKDHHDLRASEHPNLRRR